MTLHPAPALANDLLPWIHHRDAFTPPDAYTAGAPVTETLTLNNGWEFGVLTYGAHPFGFAWDIYTAAGTWNVTWHIPKRSDYGIQQAKVDGVNIGTTFDAYLASAASNVTYVTKGVVLTRGLHRFEVITTGTKNASSSAHLMVVTGLTLARSS